MSQDQLEKGHRASELQYEAGPSQLFVVLAFILIVSFVVGFVAVLIMLAIRSVDEVPVSEPLLPILNLTAIHAATMDAVTARSIHATQTAAASD